MINVCGIVGCILKEEDDVAPILFDCISKLEYRGYDSIGLATFSEDKIHIKKDKGKIIEVDKSLDLTDMPGSFGIAHVRWATHGDPSKLNAHPHVDEENRVAVVHNGIIENYLEIKDELTKKGMSFYSETDTETVAKLLEFHSRKVEDKMGIRASSTTEIISSCKMAASSSVINCPIDSGSKRFIMVPFAVSTRSIIYGTIISP